MTNNLFELNTNLNKNFKVHDPALVKENNKWWIFHTGKGIGVKSSNDLIEWQEEDSVLESPLSWWDEYVDDYDVENDVWAPDLEYFNGKWWLYYSVSKFGTNDSLIGLLSTDNLDDNNWEDHGLVITSTSGQNYNSIDPNFFTDLEGEPWLVFGSWFDGIKLSKISKDNMKVDGNIYSLANRKVGIRPAGIEAPTLTYKDGYYYLFVSIDHCCRGNKSDYKIAYGRSKKITGPYYDKNGIDLMEKGGSILAAADQEYVGYGGQDIYENKYLIHHAYNRLNNNFNFFIKELEWENNWPKIKNYDIGFDSYYEIINMENNKKVAVKNAKTEARAKIIESNEVKSNSSHWLIYPVDINHFRIQNRHSLLYMEVEDAEKIDGANVQQWSNSRNYCQEWEFVNLEADIYKIINKNSKKALTNSEDNYLIQMDYNDLESQKWKLKKL